MAISSLLVLLIYGFVFTWLTIPRVAEVVRKYKIFRKPSERDLHWRFVPKLTGLAFYVALLVVAFAFVPFVDVQRLILVLGAGAIIVYVGIRDDIYQLRPIVKLVLQLVAIAFFVFGGFGASSSASAIAFRDSNSGVFSSSPVAFYPPGALYPTQKAPGDARGPKRQFFLHFSRFFR